MKRGPSGTVLSAPPVGGEMVRAFVPKPLPPTPSLVIDAVLREEIDQALLALGRLDSVSSLLPDTALFLYTFVRKEAVLSSQIEGTQSSLSDLLLFEIEEAPGVPLDDTREVSNYVRALEYGVKRMRDNFPLSNRLLREVHGELLSQGRGSEKRPGEFRTSQNWIGGARPGVATFVPPPPDKVQDCMGALEKFLHDKSEHTSTLLKAALAHVQFETIHPFLDGNGRLGRLLITLLLVSDGVLQEPLLYLSLYFKSNRQTYYDLLQRVRTDGDWEAWISFFMRGVKETAEGAVTTAQRLAKLFKEDRERIEKLGRVAGSALRVHYALQQHPIQTINTATERSGLTVPTVTAVMKLLETEGIVRELTGKQRGRVFGYDRYLQILNEGTTTPPDRP
ncbi:MAG: Fic family protein [Planctomycetes bacterium]|nr:Fic family protein [Planctomycetota bacterium]